jgi:hypothetical protein
MELREYTSKIDGNIGLWPSAYDRVLPGALYNVIVTKSFPCRIFGVEGEASWPSWLGPLTYLYVSIRGIQRAFENFEFMLGSIFYMGFTLDKLLYIPPRIDQQYGGKIGHLVRATGTRDTFTISQYPVNATFAQIINMPKKEEEVTIVGREECASIIVRFANLEKSEEQDVDSVKLLDTPLISEGPERKLNNTVLARKLVIRDYIANSFEYTIADHTYRFFTEFGPNVGKIALWLVHRASTFLRDVIDEVDKRALKNDEKVRSANIYTALFEPILNHLDEFVQKGDGVEFARQEFARILLEDLGPLGG